MNKIFHCEKNIFMVNKILDWQVFPSYILNMPFHCLLASTFSVDILCGFDFGFGCYLVITAEMMVC